MPVTWTEGFLLVDKPAGITSHDVVAVVRRATGLSRVGHTGTLDPFATGLLVVLVGRATRLAQFIRIEPKTYEAAIVFGRETVTDDATGETRRVAVAPTIERIVTGTEQLTGSIEQLPPEYSAKQVGGTRAYAAARRGAPLQLQPVPVRVLGWSIHRYVDGTLYATISCGGGTYVRALARDLGRLTDSAAHLGALRRTHAGAFDVTEAATLDAVANGVFVVRPAQEALTDLPLEQLTEETERHVRHGRAVPAHVPGERAALVDRQGVLLAVADRKNDLWHPNVVLAGA
jgi:tRNA pseudouridine55 synthase